MNHTQIISLGLGLLVCSTMGVLANATAATPPAPSKAEIAVNCTTSKEFITALEFLRSKKEYNGTDADAQKLARQISEGCTGAAMRFIKTTMILSETGLSWGTALNTGLDFSKRSDAQAETFVKVFAYAFAEEGLDLDLAASLKLAHSLSDEFKGDQKNVRMDFEAIVRFCARSENLGLPKSRCGDYAARLARQGEQWSGGISKPFLEAFDFLRSEKGAALITGDALQIAEKLIGAGPGATENFIQAYKYGISEKGLSLARNAALDFANQMSVRKISEEK